MRQGDSERLQERVIARGVACTFREENSQVYIKIILTPVYLTLLGMETIADAG